MRRPFWSRARVEQLRAGAFLGEAIAGVAEGAFGEREAAAADALVELISQAGQGGDAILQFVLPFCG